MLDFSSEESDALKSLCPVFCFLTFVCFHVRHFHLFTVFCFFQYTIEVVISWRAAVSGKFDAQYICVRFQNEAMIYNNFQWPLVRITEKGKV